MNESNEEVLSLLSVLKSFIIADCHKWESHFKGRYETRYTGQFDPVTKNYILKGSGQCVNIHNQINEMMYKLRKEQGNYNDRGNDKSQA